jgi:RimJ/RimL family protein N-acetyltransferase
MKLEPTSSWRTDRIELFLLEPQHVGPAYVAWLQDPEINRYLESRFAIHTEQSTREFVRDCLGDDRTLFLGIRAVAFGALHVGNIKIGPMDSRHGLGEVGILIGERSTWGHGIATHAIRAVADIARDQLGLRKLTAGCYASNVASCRAFERAGFEIEGRRRDHFLLDGHPEGLVLMGRWLR